MKRKKKSDPELSRCPRCKGVFLRHRWNVCDRCLPAEEMEYARIREELVQSPELSAEDVAKAAQVSVSTVFRMLGEGLLATSDAKDQACGRCGAQAISAKLRLCTHCLLELDGQLAAGLRDARKHRSRGAAMRGKAEGLLALLRQRRRMA